MTSKREKWDRRFLALAEHVAQWSKDPSTKVGAVIADEKNRVVSIGYNGFPRGVQDSPARLKNREMKYKFVVHGDLNAIMSAQRSVANCRIYVVPFMPCSTCAGAVIQAGISEVIAPKYENPRWIEDLKVSKTMFKEAGIKLTLY
jgi:dCMP deaminase